MPKPNFKKELQKFTKEQLIEQVMDLYKKDKPVKEYYDFYLNSNEKELFEKAQGNYHPLLLADLLLSKYSFINNRNF